MVRQWSRRAFVRAVPGVVYVMPVVAASGNGVSADSMRRWRSFEDGQAASVVHTGFPAHEPALVREVVGASHNNLGRVRELVERRPALANATWDWGYGDWESALGAASHTGQRAIAELLLAHGARPTIFSAAMLGQLAVVRAFVTADAAAARIKGPHGITLLSHARAGGPQSAEVLKYLETVAGADDRPAAVPLATGDAESLVGRYVFGARDRDRFEVDLSRGALGIASPGGSRRGLTHVGSLAFFPVGAPAVRIRFVRSAGAASSLLVEDGDVTITATRA